VPKPPPGDDNVGRMQFLLALRKRGIGDANVLRAMDEVPREHFVDKPFVGSAYADQALPIACAHRLRPDHQPALCGRLHDRASGR
jgi:protein-L-isoaspartate(D-aspartate) O-methyltransferase